MSIHKSYVGKNVKLYVKGVQSMFSGKLSEDADGRVSVEDQQGRVWDILAEDIATITEDIDAKVAAKRTPRPLLFCRCDEIGCKGVQMVSKGMPPTEGDYERFMSECPCRMVKCKKGALSDFRGISDEIADICFLDMVLGEYPESDENGEKSENTTRKT